MGYRLRAGAGGFLATTGLISICIGFARLLKVGTCASGTNTPYVIARQCPSSTGLDEILVFGGVVAMLAGAILFTYRKLPRPDDDPNAMEFNIFNWSSVMFGAIFTAAGTTAAVTYLTTPLPAGSNFAAAFCGGLFLLMGAPILALQVRALITRRPPASPQS
jgi:hypothetical protein